MRRAPLFAPLVLLLAVALAAPASAHGGRHGTGRTSIVEQPVVSFQEWIRLKELAQAEREQHFIDSGAYEVAAAAPTPASAVLPKPTRGNPSDARWSGRVTFNP